MQSISINDIMVEVVRKRIKNIHLSVYPPNGRVRIAVPLNTEDDTIKLYIISKLSWIKRNRRKFENQERQSPREFVERESHYFQGKRYLLKVIESGAPQKIELKSKNIIALYIKPNSTPEQRQDILNVWYRKQLKQQIPIIIGKWQTIIGVEELDWKVRLMKTKWGTCNIEAKYITLNLELAKKPLHCLEYIIVHEMIHLLERYHNDRFEANLDKFMPKWRIYKEELNSLPISHVEWMY